MQSNESKQKTLDLIKKGKLRLKDLTSELRKDKDIIIACVS